MDRYDWDWNRGYGWGRPGPSYGRDFRGPGGWWEGGYPTGRRQWGGFRPGWHGEAGEPRYGDGYRGRRGWGGGFQAFGGGSYRGGYDAPGFGPRYGGDYGGYGGGYGGGYAGGYGGTAGSYGGPYGYDRFRPEMEDAADRWLEERFGDDDDFDDDLPWLDEPLPASAEPDDTEIRQRVWDCLQEDGYVDAGAIEIEVKDRVVTLRGEVGDYMEARYAWDDAWEAEGVRGVISKLEIRGEGRQEAPPDAARKATDSITPRKRSGRTPES